MIPKKIHYCWFGGKAKPEVLLNCINSWERNLPDYEIIEWNETNYNLNKSNFVKLQYERGRWAFVADYVRIDVLKKYGGVYLDTDMEVLRSLDDFLDNSFFTCFEKGISKDELLVSTAIIGAEKNQEILNEFLDFYEDIDIQEVATFKVPNTKILSNILSKKHSIDFYKNSNQSNENVAIYSSDYFSPKNWATKELETSLNTYAIHHFDASWKSNKDKLLTKIVILTNKVMGPKVVRNIKKILRR
ncbi:glycosyltransferase family 32 protein [Terribacillus sp. DMT04]|uniref:glycosyltransferase family 32 protein n=1 Tax=Terribacillus sp. DMT04 TaxID=2850441 RepID=UPI001C2C08C1|nr:glycosyltransferase [Terribacillus sp. DMT04]QXE01065.1 glycosyl transferase [Terribacillus sp. DMT04]